MIMGLTLKYSHKDKQFLLYAIFIQQLTKIVLWIAIINAVTGI
jgi:hypothetical protein